jgi:uncharacterized protein YndB with AHSA1/START domain
MSDRNIVHATFTLERTYSAPVPRVFHAWADPGVKALWFAGGPNGYEMDFRPDGIERNLFAHDGKKITWESLYREIVPERRIVYTSVLSEDDAVATVSLTTVEFSTDGRTTSLVLTETGAYLDGRELPEWREQGTADWLDSLGRHLAEAHS